jgi:PAS domain S-box-containing protein
VSEVPVDDPSRLDPGRLLDALPRAVVVTDPDGRITHWNAQAEQLFGWTTDEVLDRSVTDVLVPASHRDQAEAVMAQARDGNQWSGDFTVLHRDGSPRRIRVSNNPVLDGAGQVVAIVGASEDVTDQRTMEQANADLMEHLRLAIEAGQFGTFRWDMATGATEWDEKLEALFGLPPGGFDGTFEGWVALLHPEDRDEVLAVIEDAVEQGARYTVRHRVVWPDGSTRWVEGSGQTTFDASGAVTGTIGCTRDITGQVLAESERQRLTLEAVDAAEQERIHRERLEFLAGINEAVASAADRHEVMVNVARAAVPRLGDWCSVYVLPRPGDGVPEVEIAHLDPEMVAYARRLQEELPYDPDAPTGIAQVIRTGTAEYHPVIDDETLDAADASAATRDVVRDLRLRSAMAVPLVKRGRILGAIQLVMTESRRRYTAEDFTLAQAVAARIASSLDNLRLADEQRAIATALQASLLPGTLPEIPGIDTAVRYWANGEAVEVGGDFYDLFTIEEGSWAVVIGDVCGTGPAAAGVTGLARHTIASSAWHGDDQCRVLQDLNRALRSRQLETFCTALYGTLDATDRGTTFTFAVAGHPLPILARDGQATSVGVPGRLAGVFDHIEPTSTTVELRPGDVVVLYTDGATDVAPPHGLTPAQFEAIVGRCASTAGSADEVAEGLRLELSRILPIEQRHDDIALLVLHVLDPR